MHICACVYLCFKIWSVYYFPQFRWKCSCRLIFSLLHLAIHYFFFFHWTHILVRDSFSSSAFPICLFLARRDIIEHSRPGPTELGRAHQPPVWKVIWYLSSSVWPSLSNSLLRLLWRYNRVMCTLVLPKV